MSRRVGPSWVDSRVLPDLVVPVARASHLVVLKILARDDESRPQDAIDLRSLRPILSTADADEVRGLAALVADRGFDRGRDIVGLAEAYLSGD